MNKFITQEKAVCQCVIMTGICYAEHVFFMSICARFAGRWEIKMELIKLVDIHKIYNRDTSAQINALNGVNLIIQDKSMVSIIGKSGSGKSTLLHIMGCLDVATKGSYFLFGEDMSTANSNSLANVRNEKIGFVLQEFGLLLNKTVFENVAIPLFFSNKCKYKDINKQVDNILEQINIQGIKKQIVGELSGGQKQRVAIARAMVNNPDILLADEPTGALDSSTSEDIISVFKQLHNEGKTIIIVTHDSNIASQCEKVICISDGLIVT